MIRNYIKIAWRNLIKNKGYTAINISGLAVGTCCFLLISMFVKSEFSYDNFHDKGDRIYRIWQHENYGPKEDFVNTTTPVSMVKVLRNDYPEIENGSRVYKFNSIIKRDHLEFTEIIRAVDTSFFQIFDFQILKGNAKFPFSNASSVVLSQSSATKYFGSENPIGQSLEVEIGGEYKIFIVSAISVDPPKESSIQFGILLSLENEPLFFDKNSINSWFNVSVESYVLLKENQSSDYLESKFPSVVKKYLGNNFIENTFFIHLQPLIDIHLNTSLPVGHEPISDPKYSYIMASIGFLVLFLACINFITLAIGRSSSRATEVGVRKTLGAFRQQIIYQFWGEALLITLLAVILGVFLAYLFLGTFNNLTGKLLQLSFDSSFWLVTFGMVLFITLIAGVYPSIIISKFNPVHVLKGKSSKGDSMGMLRRSLVVVQFAVSIIMIICSLVIGNQIDFLVNKGLGYQKNAIIVVPTNKSGSEAEKLSKRYISELKKQSNVIEATSSIFSFAENAWAEVGFTDSKNVYREFAFNAVDPNFLKTHNISIHLGRDFQEGNVSDNKTGILVNEAFIKELGIENPVGATIEKFGVQIIGVVKDFNFEKLSHKIRPLVLSIDPSNIQSNAENVSSIYEPLNRVSVKFNNGNTASNIAILKNTWQQVNTSQEFEYFFLEDSLAAQYKQEIRSKNIVNIASILSIFIACIGLFGLATLNVARRKAEIGIRKVLGATVGQITFKLTLNFLKLVVVAVLISLPIGWYAMNKWLEDFEYRIKIGWEVFALAIFLAITIALLAVSYQSIKAAIVNPIRSLRSE